MQNIEAELECTEEVEADGFTAMELGQALHEWARTNGALTQSDAVAAREKIPLKDIFDTDEKTARTIAETLQRLKVTSVAADDQKNSVSVLCKGTISATASKKLPKRANGVDFQYTGKVVLEANPPVIPHSATSGSPVWFEHDGRIACGSSVTCAQTFAAGTLGFLATMADGTIVGFSNNHVTGDSNHTPPGMHILSPSPFDASPASPPPVAIGTHLALAAMHSGDPHQISLQELDAALFRITQPDAVTSMQGNGQYDTPDTIVNPAGGMRVKKIGRTTGLRTGQIIGEAVLPLAIPYKSARFTSIVYFTDVWVVQGDGGNTFSEGGDSGSLVSTADGKNAVGVVFAGGQSLSFIIPIEKILKHFNISLLSNHNVEVADGQGKDGEEAITQAQPEGS